MLSQFSGAVLDQQRQHRFLLWRFWDDSPRMLFIGLNPSTADEYEADPTIRRCMAFARTWGYGGMYMMNIFAFRTYDPKILKDAPDPIGPRNDHWLLEIGQEAKIIIAAWGVHGAYLGRDKEVRKMLTDLHYLRLTKEGFPSHPLYLSKALKPIAWEL